MEHIVWKAWDAEWALAAIELWARAGMRVEAVGTVNRGTVEYVILAR